MEGCEIDCTFSNRLFSSCHSPRNMSTPWGKTQAAPVMPCSLQDVMSEQLATELQHQEEKER